MQQEQKAVQATYFSIFGNTALAFIKGVTGYFGYKLHAIITKEGIPYDFTLSKASVHDIHGLKELVTEEIASSTILADKGYNIKLLCLKNLKSSC